MNLRILSIGIASIFPSFAFAATVKVNVSFESGLDAYLVEDVAGNAATGATVFIGTFEGGITSSNDLNYIASNFRQFSDTTMGPTPQGFAGFPGAPTNFEDDFNNSPTNTANFDFSGLGIYVVIANVANAVDLINATEIAILRDDDDAFNWTFPTGSIPSPDRNINMVEDIDSNTEFVFGSLDTLNVSSTDFTSIKLQAIPEPSSLALLGLGAVATLFRRRR